MILTNCTDTQRGIMLKKGIILLGPREMRTVPIEEQDEIKAMFACTTFQRFVDNGIFRLSKMRDDEQSVEVETPEPPANLTSAVGAEGLVTPVSTETGPKSQEPVVVEHQTGGPLPSAEQNKKSKK